MTTPPKRKSRTRAYLTNKARLWRRPIYVFLLTVLAVAFFVLTFEVNRLYANKQEQLSSSWFQKGQDALAQGKPNEAIADLRTALLYSHEDKDYLFTLAQALEAGSRRAEARSYLLSLWEDEPGDGPVNLELAHLAAKEDDVNQTLRYYNGAIYGAWPTDPISKRQQAHQDLINFLISKGMKTQARGELFTFSTETPNTLNSKLWVAQAFSRLGDDRSALDFYNAALHINRRDVGALLGAAWSNFRLGHYREALDFFTSANEIHSDSSTSQMEELSSLIVDLNPLDSRISTTERRHRLKEAMDVADKRLQQCAESQQIDLDTVGADPLQLAASRWTYLNNQIRQARRDSELLQLLSPVASLITTVEQHAGCGPSSVEDQAMLRIYQNNGEELQP